MGVFLTLASFAAQAHHSFAAIWDENHSFSITGTLSKVEWMNPHSYVHVAARQSNGIVSDYSFEGFPPLMLRNYGVTKDMFQSRVGQTVTVTAYVAKDGTKTLGFGRTYKFGDGTTIVTVRDPADIQKEQH